MNFSAYWKPSLLLLAFAAAGTASSTATVSVDTALIAETIWPSLVNQLHGCFPMMNPTMIVAGRMKQVPATMRPDHRALLCPMWIAIFVEFGPGMKFVALR